MGKVAVAAAAAVLGGLGAFSALAGVLPAGWAEGAALVLTGGTLLGASFAVERKKAPRQATAVRLPAQRAQEA